MYPDDDEATNGGPPPIPHGWERRGWAWDRIGCLAVVLALYAAAFYALYEIIFR
jgi:hypothetical protein